MERETDSNPRRPAWEDDCKLETKNIAFPPSRSGDREHPVFTLCRRAPLNGAQTEHTNLATPHLNRPDRVFKFGTSRQSARTGQITDGGAHSRLLAGRQIAAYYKTSNYPDGFLLKNRYTALGWMVRRQSNCSARIHTETSLCGTNWRST